MIGWKEKESVDTNQQLQIINQRELSDQILERVGQMQSDGLALPKNYNPSNALQLAFLQLVDMKIESKANSNYGKLVLDVVSKKSVSETLLNMVLQGLSPAKKQVYFIPYGNELKMQRSYFGTQTVLKRLNAIRNVWANVIYEGDTFEMKVDESGRERLVKHDTNFLNRDNKMLGAYAIIDTSNDGQLLTVMTMKEIEASWKQAKTTNVHRAFPQEMAKRTVINRAAKNIVNSSDDSDMLIQSINETTENEYEGSTEIKDVTADDNKTTQSLLEEFKALEDEGTQVEAEKISPPNDSEKNEAYEKIESIIREAEANEETAES